MNAVSSGARLIRLRRDALPPLRFLGRSVARHDGRFPAAALWYELALYSVARDLNMQVPAGGYAVHVMACIPAGPARCHAWLAASLDGALEMLESHDPAQDACPGLTVTWVEFERANLQPGLLATHLARLHCDLHGLDRSYRIAVGSFLARLGAERPDL